MSVTDKLLRDNEAHPAGCVNGDLQLPPARRLALLACMDARLDPARALVSEVESGRRREVV